MGWAYLTDVTFALWKDYKEYSNFYRFNRPTEAELMLAMELDLKRDRLQCTVLGNGFFQHNVMVRAVQGHPGRIGKKIKNDLAFTRVYEADCLSHYSKMRYLSTSLDGRAEAWCLEARSGRAIGHTSTVFLVDHHSTARHRTRIAATARTASLRSTT